MITLNQICTLVIALILVTSCRPVTVGDDPTIFNANTELAQQVGDAMSSVDESASSTGDFAMYKEIESAKLSLAFLNPAKKKNKIEMLSHIISEANAASCFGLGFSACTSGVITRNFNNCTAAGATFNGSVVLTYSGPTSATCKLDANTDAVKRSPNFQIATAVGTVAVSKTGTNGQVLSYTSGSAGTKVFSLTSDGLRRIITNAANEIKHDVTTSTTSAITVTGSSRSNRVMSGGGFRLQNTLNNETCDIAPSNVTWSGTCTCATSGTWVGTCSVKGAFNLVITGCGTATLTVGSEAPKQITLNRCSGS